MEEPSPSPDCQACGACCFSLLDTYVRVTGDDWARLGADAERVARFIGHRAYLRMEVGRCAALAVLGAADGGARYACTIYDRRPQICRDLARGSPQCEAERELKAGSAAAALPRGRARRPAACG